MKVQGTLQASLAVHGLTGQRAQKGPGEKEEWGTERGYVISIPHYSFSSTGGVHHALGTASRLYCTTYILH